MLSAEQNRLRPEAGKRTTLMYGLSFAMIVLGVKLMIVSGFGSPVPYWDQWDAEADRLYRPFLEGSLRFGDLFAPHNEHRIFTTRVLGLALLAINRGVWDPMFEMYVNAVIHTGALALLIFLMQRGISGSIKPVISGFGTLLFAVPFGNENLLAGFQSQFYFLMLFSFVLLWAAYKVEQTALHWAVVVALMSLLSYFSMASGALSIGAAAGLLLVRRVVGADRSPVGVAIFVALAVGFIIAVFFTPTIPAHASLKAKNPIEFMLAFLAATGGGILYLPVFVFMIRQWIMRPSGNDHSWFVFALCLWVLGQILAIAYGRWHGILSSRYLDLFAIGLLLNFYCLIYLIKSATHHSLAKKGLVVWLLLFMTLLGAFVPRILQKMNDKKMTMLENRKNVSGYLITGNDAYLHKKPDDEIPYPDADRLKSLLDNPVISGILTPDVNGRNSNAGYEFYTGKMRKTMSLVGSLLVFYGVSMLLFDNIRNVTSRYED